MADTVAYVRSVEQLVIDALADLGLPDAGRLDDYPGVWVEPTARRPARSRPSACGSAGAASMHGFALNVDPDLRYFDHIVPCGIADKAVTSLRGRGHRRRRCARSSTPSSPAPSRAGAAATRRPRRRRLARTPPTTSAPFSAATAAATERPGDAGRDACACGPAGRGRRRPTASRSRERKPEWLRAKVRHRRRRTAGSSATMRDLDLVTVCEEAGCPNIFECWADGTATFMINGERCTRACGFCLVDTRHPLAARPRRARRGSPRPSSAWASRYAVVTAVARDDLADGGAARVRRDDRRHPRAARPAPQVEVLIPDCKGDPDALDAIFDARPDVLNHNIETVARLQRAVRPSAVATPGQPVGAGPGQGRRAHHQVAASSSAWARPTTRSSQTLADLRGRRRRHRHHRPVPAARPTHHLPVAPLV